MMKFALDTMDHDDDDELSFFNIYKLEFMSTIANLITLVIVENPNSTTIPNLLLFV